MRTNYRILTIVTTLATISMGLTWFLWPSTEEVPPEMSSAEAGGPDRTHEAEVEQQDSEPGKDLRMSVENIRGVRCEHEMPTYKCGLCRYQVGVVKVDASLLKDSSESKAGLVRTMTVSNGTVDTVLHTTGEVHLNGNATARITPRMSGVITSMKVDIGTEVKKDEVLFEIESAELGRALSEYERGKALSELSQKTLEREKSLFDRKISSESDVIEAQMAYEQNRAELKAAEQKLRVLGLRDSDFTAVRHDPRGILIRRLPVRAPWDGTIIEKHGVVGEVVEPGKDVILLADLRTVWVWATIYEQNMRLLLENKQRRTIPVTVSVHAFPGQEFQGDIDYIGATMDEQTRTVKVRATVSNDKKLLRPGMFCEVRITVTSGRDALLIPRAALLSDEGHDFVFKHLEEDYYVRREVKKGQEFDESVEILEGLRPGEVIVADGAFLLKSDVLRSKMGAGCAD